MKWKVVSFSISQELRDRLEETAEAEGMNKSQIVRYALSMYTDYLAELRTHRPKVEVMQ